MIVPRRPFGPVVITLASIAVMAGLGPLAPAVADVATQFPGLSSGKVTALIDGEPFSSSVTIAMMDEGKLILSSLSNSVQIQISNAKVGTFEFELDDDGGLIDVIVGLKTDDDRYVMPVTGSLTIESLSGSAASGRFEFDGKDLDTEAAVKVTNGRFEATLLGG